PPFREEWEFGRRKPTPVDVASRTGCERVGRPVFYRTAIPDGMCSLSTFGKGASPLVGAGAVTGAARRRDAVCRAPSFSILHSPDCFTAFARTGCGVSFGIAVTG
ncbi:MAG: hypothetical protein LBT76_02585, partial [Tannerella sp.]|nr:hypothetical protein [Tannerella sp.]